jgi:hypothetical protein
VPDDVAAPVPSTAPVALVPELPPPTVADGVKTGVEICAKAPKAANATLLLTNRLTKFMGEAEAIRKLVGVAGKAAKRRAIL